jgi:indole-3-glycerol phosphate synthase
MPPPHGALHGRRRWPPEPRAYPLHQRGDGQIPGLDMGSPRIPSCEVSGGCRGVVQDSVDEVATSSHAAEANAGGTTEQEGNGSPVAAAAAYSPVVAGVDGIRIRRRPVTGPAVHYVGPFQFRLENEGNTPRNILEKIIWNKDVEVSQARLVDENGVMIKPARSTVTLCDFVFLVLAPGR